MNTPTTTHAKSQPIFKISLRSPRGTRPSPWTPHDNQHSLRTPPPTPLTKNVKTRASDSTTAVTAPWSSNPHRNLKGPRGDSGRAVPWHNARRGCAMRLVEGPTGNAGILLQCLVRMKSSTYSVPEHASKDRGPMQSSELRSVPRLVSD